MNWENWKSYRNSWSYSKSKRDQTLIRLVKHLYPDIYTDTVREKQWKRYISERRKDKAKVYKNTVYKHSESYKQNLRKYIDIDKVKNRDICHSSLSWILEQIKCVDGELVYPEIYKNNKTGYWFTRIYGKTYMVSRLVYIYHNKSFVPSGVEVDHIDGNKDNNNISNLQLLTHEANMFKFHISKEGLSKRKDTYNYYWDVLCFYHAQPHKNKIENTVRKYNVNKCTLNKYSHLFPKDYILSGEKEKCIEEQIEKDVSNLLWDSKIS
jgi:hypothetical protein